MILFTLKSYSNCCLFLFYDMDNNTEYFFELSEYYNDYKAINTFIKEHNNTFIIGYNMEKYYNYILNYLFINYYKIINEKSISIASQIYYLSENMFQNNYDISLKNSEYHRPLDLIKYIGNSNERISLNDIKVHFSIPIIEPKTISVFFIKKEEMDSLRNYLRSNIQTLFLLYTENKEKIRFRFDLSNEIKSNLINKFDETIGNNVIMSYYKNKYNVPKSKIIALKEKENKDYRIQLNKLLYNDFKFINNDIKIFYEQLQNITVTNSFNLDHNLHVKNYNIKINKYLSKEFPVGLIQDDIINIDYKLLYVYLIGKNNIYPDFLDDEFSKTISSYYNKLSFAIKTNNKKEIYKNELILLNLVDNMSIPSSFTESSITQNKILINALLIILKLIDLLINNDIEIYFLDKNSITLKNDKSLSSILQEWYLYFPDFKCEKYIKIAYENLNNMLILKDGFDYNKNEDEYVIEKGLFKTNNSFNFKVPLIIPKTFRYYFITGKSEFEFIKSNKDDDNFKIVYKVNKTFDLEYNKNPIQRFLVFFWSLKGDYLYRINNSNNKKEQLFNKKISTKKQDKYLVDYYNQYLLVKQKYIQNQLTIW